MIKSNTNTQAPLHVPILSEVICKLTIKMRARLFNSPMTMSPEPGPHRTPPRDAGGNWGLAGMHPVGPPKDEGLGGAGGLPLLRHLHQYCEW